ncbi:MAG: hypothetical protein ACI9R3_004854, partial [Verrucomicrobiales bacterium]
PQLQNSIRNTFSEAGEPNDPEPPGPTARTGNQFQSGTAYGGWQATRIKVGPTVVAGSTSEVVGAPGTIITPSYTPIESDGVTPIPGQRIQLRSVKMGRPMVLRTVSFPLGSVIKRPDRKPNGAPLDPDVFAEAEFYFKEPANAASGRFYWSPHAEKVFATEPGVITVDWKERLSGNVFTQSYTISGSPVKPSKTIYWTERGFNGPLVKVEKTRVAEVNILYSDIFPEFVDFPDAFDFDPTNPPDLLPPVITAQNPLDPPGTPQLQTKTLWHDTVDNAIHAYNTEGRVFVELLGDLREPDRIYREHLGFEIVDVVQETRPDELRVAIGDRVLPVDEADMTAEEEALVADPVAGKALDSDPYLYEHLSLGGTSRTLYAIKETTPLRVLDRNGDSVIDELDEQQSNEVLIYWKEEGIMQLQWPKKYVGYIFKWPEEYLAGAATEAELREFYSMYARPELASDAEATGIQLNSANNPILTYQDDETNRHAQITALTVFFTKPGTGNRSLIRYTNGDEIWFERVYSRVNDEFDDYNTSTSATVGSRIDPPTGIASPVGYIRQTSGDAFNARVYVDPFLGGFTAAAKGAIIPVNALAGNDVLEVWWYEESLPPADTSTFTSVRWPSYVKRYQQAWPVTDADDANIFDEIVMARNDGSGDLGIAATGSIYRQADAALAGFNPNEEHALMSGGVAWALRDDLNRSDSSEPFVLVDYTAEDGRPAMVIRCVVRENAAYTFNYEAPVGVILQAPMPLPVIPLPIDASGKVSNVEIGAPTDVPTNFVGNEAGYEHYERFTYVDRKGSTWIYRGPHGDGVNVGSVTNAAKKFSMHYFYKTQASFDFPGVTAPAVGSIVRYLRPYTNGTDASGGFVNAPLNVTFTPVWPSNPPVLGVAETLALPKRGLPAVRGQSSARLLYEQSTGEDLALKTRSAKMIDPTRAKTYEFSTAGLEKVPGSIATSDYLGKTFFPNLPPHLSERLFVDPNIGELGALVFIGEFVDDPFGEDYFLLNVMSPEDVVAAKGLADSSDVDLAKWQAAIDGLQTVLETFIEDPARRGTYKVSAGLNVRMGTTAVAEVPSDDTAVDSYAISAAGGGTGYVVMATGDGEAFTPAGDPVSLHVFKVAPPLYRGELKVLASANPLDEKLTLQHSGDFAGDPNDYEFAWITGQPVSGFPPSLYSFTSLEVLGNGAGRAWRFLNNPARGYQTARDYSFDASAWTATGDLSANQLTINDGNGTEANGTTLPNAILRDTFDWGAATPIDLYLSLIIADNDGAVIYLNGAEIAVWNVPGRTNSVDTTPPGTLSDQTLSLVFAVTPEALQAQNTVTVDLYTASDTRQGSSFDLRLDSQQETADISGWQPVDATVKDVPGTAADDESAGEIGKPRHTIGGASILTLTDNYFTMRYRAIAGTAAATATGGGATTPGEWSRWMPSQLAEGWIKRALAGINPFNQRVTDLFNNEVNSDVSLLTQAGPRWEGDIALNLESINDFGLIEIYETILRRGKSLSIDGAPALNVPAANDALLLAAGYLNDLYILVGNEAFADAANPTIAFSTDGGNFGTSGQFGEFNTALFAFKGQLPSVLEEELALLRGRDDNLQPGVQVAPVYNRLVWNFTRGINSGEVVYALNYNIKDLNADGAANTVDAIEQFPQGHGDAYGHYLTALKGYYGLLHNPNFAWTPRIEAVSVLGQPVSIDYQDERKFASAAAALARTASQTLDLTYRKEFTADENTGWAHLRDGKVNSGTGVTRYWGTDAWATRAGLGAYFHWVTANSILPESDTIHEGIEKVDRTTVPELDEVAAQAEAIQLTLDNADARLNPLGLAQGAMAFDISPTDVDDGKTHFEQVFDRAIGALRNADFAFDNAKDSTQLLRGQEDSLDARRHAINLQEMAYENQLVELYGTPYTDDVGPGKTYAQGYEGPDLIHYQYVDVVELFFTPSDAEKEVVLPISPAFLATNSTILNYDRDRNGLVDLDQDGNPTVPSVVFSLNAAGEFVKPSTWTGRRTHPGRIQTAISNSLSARLRVRQAADEADNVLGCMVDLLQVYSATVNARNGAVRITNTANDDVDAAQAGILAANVIARVTGLASDTLSLTAEAVTDGFPKVIGFSNDLIAPARGLTRLGFVVAKTVVDALTLIAESTADGLDLKINRLQRQLEVDLESQGWTAENRQLIRDLQVEMAGFQDLRAALDIALRDYNQTQRDLQSAVAEGFVIQKEREVFRKRAAAIVQGYRTRDLAFRVFRDEALEKYKTLFDLAARYTFLAARAYDYETGLLDGSGNSAAAAFFDGVVQSRALGVIDGDGSPQFSASTTGDPGLAGVLAQMQGDWAVGKSRLGFNNPDHYRTTFSLRQENYRIVPGATGDQKWQDTLASRRMANVLDDPDVQRFCMQIADENGLPVPGIVIPFSTTIAQGFNFFGRPLAAGDHGFSPSSFATKIRATGIGFDGYIGMDSPSAAGGALLGIGAQSPSNPDLGFLDPQGLSATPYVYLIPAGVDSMRSPPLGDTSTVRSWTVDDQAIPLPFNIGNSDFATNAGFTSGESLSEEPFAIRKHQAFRAVSGETVFSSAAGFTNARLIGRSVWNSNWKIVIPGSTLRSDAESGLEAFQATVDDIKLFFESYSYSGN